MMNFNRLSIAQIENISKIFSTHKLLSLDFIKRKYNRNAAYFDNTIEFLKQLCLLDKVKSKLILSKNYGIFLKRYKDSGHSNILLKKYIVGMLIQNNSIYTEYLYDFLSKFKNEKNEYIFRATTSQKLKYGGIRNFLIDLGLIKLINYNKGYIISDKHSSLFKNFIKKRKMSIVKLKELIIKREELGYNAEIAILKYEKEKLKAIPRLIDKIKHISKEDVKAGYDIESYEILKNNNYLLIYIEVKAVSSNKYEFEWTLNEIDKSKILKEKYFLYLLPVISINKFDMNRLKIIRNPFKNVYENRNWKSKPRVLTFSLK